LLEASIEGAHGVLLSVAGGADLGLHEITEAARLVSDAAHPEANIIFGTVIDDTLGDEVRVTVIAAGFDGGAPLPRLTTPNRASASDGFIPSANMPAGRDSIDLSSRTEEVGRPLAPATRAVSFEDNPATNTDADDLDVPDFLK
jgi:cell division protein FtsZ